ncbi:hypothetical protein [Telmatospirillum sp. J64-1]|uniref:hypothetical protein n=1 Tax=Telmatospirillum sp. J64-1 TaxID=2502183 RepID=UPI00115E056A|nr:hypothetical protein [Telmatospirillum sp. J64-1]
MPPRAIIVMLLAAIALPAPAEGNDPSCTGAPSMARLDIPRPADQWVRVTCGVIGHMLAPPPGWAWTLPGTTTPVVLPAQGFVPIYAMLGHQAHFAEIDVEELEGEQLSEAAARIAMPAERALRLTARTNGSSAYTVLFMESDEDGPAAYWCPSPDCAIANAFEIKATR